MARSPATLEIEELPEADRLDGFPHPRETVNLHGHEEAEAEIAVTFGSGRMHHAWLIEGAEGVGKATLAYRIATFLLADPMDRDRLGESLAVDPASPAAHQVRALAHPGLLVLRRVYDFNKKRFSASIPVDEVRRLRAFLGLTAAGGEWRAVIVDTADDMAGAAANALLKSLEEPPPRTVFLLLSAHPGRLLPTIRSRCRTLVLTPLSGDALRRALIQALAASGEEVSAGLPTGEDWVRLERLCGGSVRRALALMKGTGAAGGLALYDRVVKLVASLPKADWAQVHALGDELAGVAAEQRFELFYELLLGHVARLVRAAAGLPGSAEDAEMAARLIPESRLAHWAELWETLGSEKADALALNLDRKALILDTFVRLESAALSG